MFMKSRMWCVLLFALLWLLWLILPWIFKLFDKGYREDLKKKIKEDEEKKTDEEKATEERKGRTWYWILFIVMVIIIAALQ